VSSSSEHFSDDPYSDDPYSDDPYSDDPYSDRCFELQYLREWRSEFLCYAVHTKGSD
jgi:hypothetical protein